MLDIVRDTWDAITKPVGQMITSVTTFSWSALSYFNSSSFDTMLQKLSMVAAFCVTVSLIACNILRFMKDWREMRDRERKTKKRRILS